MATAVERRPRSARLSDWFSTNEMFELPDLFRPDLFRMLGRDHLDEWIRLEEVVNDHTLTIRAEMPGIDPDKDVEITVSDGVLSIRAERRAEHLEETKNRRRSEFRYGSFHRSMRVPKGVSGKDIAAAYKDGILTITVPMPSSAGTEVEKIAVSRT